MSTFKQTGKGTWTYRGFRVHRHKGNRFTYRTQIYQADVALGSRVVMLSAPSLAELKWKIDRSIDEGGMPSDMDTAEP